MKSSNEAPPMIQLRAQATHVGARFSASLPLSTFSVLSASSVLKNTPHSTLTPRVEAPPPFMGHGSRATDHATQKGRP
jgi:hypothetical protein